MKKILVAEDHPLVLMGIQQTIEEILPGSTVSKADNFPKALKLLGTENFDMMIMDINIPGGDKVSMIEAIRLKQPALPVLVNSSYDEQLYALPFLKAGANGFISKTAPNREFKNAIDAVLKGKVYASSSVLQNAFSLLANPGSSNDHVTSKLTDKELEIAKLLSKGMSTKAISESLNLSSSSISNYKTRIFDKLGVGNVIELTTYFELN
ncbi:response regulator transcription factor [Dyadobacter psychrotolerans]|uniref:response regulator transcription factor n=1 Tax=Dyadobacter psychrotolerans TaxID=2541721 RepID=UPI0014054789|nr:response regulator transcription factor [Dyadobacter psychrotolerans]